MSVYEIIKELESTPGTNDKLSILKSHDDNDSLKQFFHMALNPHLLYGIRRIPAIGGRDIPYNSLEDGMTELYKLANREFTGMAALDFLTEILSSVSNEDANLLERIICKDPDCKVSHKNVNKVWPRTVPESPYMRCASGNEKNYKRIGMPAYVQKKANGLFINIIKLKGQPLYVSRNGKEFDFLGQPDDEVIKFYKDDFVMHGEALVLEKDGTIMERKKGNGIINKAQHGTISQDEASRIIFEVWDIVPYSDWVSGNCTVPYEKRIATLQYGIKGLYTEHKDIPYFVHCLRLIETKEVQTMAEADTYYKGMIKRGEEGAVLKNKNGIWKNHTSPNQVKMKVKDPADLICVGTTEHTKKEGWIGALELQSSDGIIKVNTGSGLDDKDRQMVSNYYIGKIIEIEYNEITSDKRTGQKSLFLPIYVGVRTDKSEADSYETILERSSYK